MLQHLNENIFSGECYFVRPKCSQIRNLVHFPTLATLVLETRTTITTQEALDLRVQVINLEDYVYSAMANIRLSHCPLCITAESCANISRKIFSTAGVVVRA
jgi:hypothetical protein